MTRKKNWTRIAAIASGIILLGAVLAMNIPMEAKAGVTSNCQHWNKVIFNTTRAGFPEDSNVEKIKTGEPYEVIFPTSHLDITDLKKAVLDDFGDGGGVKLGNGDPIQAKHINIIDVEYAINCPA